MTAKLRQHSLSSVRKLQELLNDCNIQLATLRSQLQQIGTQTDSVQLRKELDIVAKINIAFERQLLELSKEPKIIFLTLRNGIECSRLQKWGIPTALLSACYRACESTKNSVLPQLKKEGNTFSQCVIGFIGCVSALLLELKRCNALEHTFHIDEAPIIAESLIEPVEEMLENLENLITVHYATSESYSESKVTPRRRRTGSCRPQCVCSDLIKTSYA